MMFCPQCGNDVKNASFCNQCGAHIVNNETAPQPEAPPAPAPPPEPPPPPPEPPPPPPVPEPPPPPPPPVPEPPPPPTAYPPPEQAPPPMTYQPPPEQSPPPAAYPPAQQQQAPPPYQQQQQYQQPPQGYQHPPAQPGFVGEVYGKTFGFLFKKPILLWAISLLFTLLICLAVVFGVVPIIWLPVIMVLQLGMANVFLRGYRGHAISSTLLFEGFGEKFARNAGGMGWRYLWMIIWGFVPIMNIVKFYSYRFVPYIMLTEPDILATEALKKSMALTNGYKGKMFIADFVIGAAVGVLVGFVLLLSFLLGLIHPLVGLILGGLIMAVISIILIALLPLIIGTLEAVYYDKISKENPVE